MPSSTLWIREEELPLPSANTVFQIWFVSQLQLPSVYTHYYFLNEPFTSFSVVAVLEIKPRASRMLGKPSTIDLYLYSLLALLWVYGLHVCAYGCGACVGVRMRMCVHVCLNVLMEA